jgi:hypothetical protein
VNLDYSLNVWHGPKVFFVEWDGDKPGAITICTFKRGAWEDELLALQGGGNA